MAGMCCGVVGETETPATVDPSGSRQTRRRQVEIQQLKFLAAAASDVVAPLPESGKKRRKVERLESSERLETIGSSVESKAYNLPVEFETPVQPSEKRRKGERLQTKPGNRVGCEEITPREVSFEKDEPRFGLTTVCGRRRDMEDAVAVKPSFTGDLDFFGVYDGHGCSHVAMKCRDRMHEIVKHAVENRSESSEWKETMTTSFTRMDEEVTVSRDGASIPSCRCELRTPQCDAVGSTAVVAVVTPENIVVANCGDSRAVLCRNGVAIPLSVDHKPDRPDELARIEAAGGRVIYWDGARVLGVLAMSRAIGNNYLKPYVIPEPEVTVTERTSGDECLILASDGLWDVVSNDVACSVARMCLTSNKHKPPSQLRSPGNDVNVSGGESSDKACSDASILLTKLALARHSSDNVSVVVIDLRRNQ